MSAFKTVRELAYEKNLAETFADIEKAFIAIGKIQQIDRQAFTIQGKTKYGLQTVYINAQVEVADGKTKVVFHGKSDDFGAVGAQRAIDNLINTMQNLDNINYVPSKTSGVKPLWVIALCIQIALSIFISFGLRTGNFQSGLMIFLVIAWIALLIYLVLARLRSS